MDELSKRMKHNIFRYYLKVSTWINYRGLIVSDFETVSDNTFLDYSEQ